MQVSGRCAVSAAVPGLSMLEWRPVGFEFRIYCGVEVFAGRGRV
jgi:hypothetical protein